MGMYDIARIDGLKICAPALDANVVRQLCSSKVCLLKCHLHGVINYISFVYLVLENTKELNQKVKDSRRNQSDLFKDGCFGTDKVKFNFPGWKERYFKEKFSAESPADMELKKQSVVEKYNEGLCWVFLYYFSEVPSWMWFYPFHYAPFASDFRGASETMKVKFHKALPFRSFDQLVGVLPPRSAHALPLAYRELMVDEKSKLIDFYPTGYVIKLWN